MSLEDREKWNARYEDSANAPREPSRMLTALDDILPRAGKALDIAGGAGRHSIWLAQRGLDVTLTDASPVGLALAEKRAEEAGVEIETVCLDLETEPTPVGPWDVILSFHYLWRPLFSIYHEILNPGGLLVVLQPTKTNLGRHDKPSERFLLEDGELPTLIERLEIVQYREGWLEEGRHDALLVAQKPAIRS